ncbi:hypothetical protein HZS38_18140 [Xenorhabdus nematophila]|uniref:DUF2384 domain-containing protein n=2 Tax=Xenorhabdus nematophila TaxID=628 RepID=D3VBU3_XENNA|nr:hypothetical protein D3790_18860 [Xenorhabdus nematophila]CBJ91932.1 conserved hypothetical protein [Xenorhabdus nematophila ATCC 19061]CCW31665.1 conserved hypothetical protein [Xenorhabdus nematophila F1]CEE90666.1 conserved hypothetical protein [Xenorhabdus nematophila str. Anatoliense]CEF33240.1 conserved hypothetical protein [Xenorhabdus nematophila str. Websteri]CEK24748.1 conserved hypothetical protein [Xenorhabdus nematophila AN6/1]
MFYANANKGSRVNTKVARKSRAKEKTLSLGYVSLLDVLSSQQEHIEHIHVTEIPPNEADRFLLVELPEETGGDFDVRDLRIALLSALNTATSIKRNASPNKLPPKFNLELCDHPDDLLGENPKDSWRTSNRKDRIETLKNAILEESTWLPAYELSQSAGFSLLNPSATPNRWKKTKKIFAISVKGKDLYPKYALDEGGLPMPIVKNIIEVFDGKKTSWGMAIWFNTPNSWLGKEKPKDVLINRPNEVLNAARQEADGPLHG